MSNVPEDTMMNWISLQNTIAGTKRRAMRALMAEYTSLLKDPAEGFVVKVDDPFNWDVGIYGPPSTPYWGGYFKVHVTFPDEYPFEPPKLKFKSRFWHPNVYHNGSVCMSILHDPQAEEIPTDLPREEKWNPTLSVRTVLLSLISIMGSPNPDSPANPEASKMYRSWLEDGDQDYVKVIEDIVRRSKKTASRDGVTVPKTLEEYLSKPKPKVDEPLVSYSSDDDSSDHSDLISLPSSQESDHDDFFDAESNWITFNHDVISVDQNNRTAFIHEESVPSLSNYHQNNITKDQNHEEFSQIEPQNTLCSNVSQPSEQGGAEFDSKLSSRRTEDQTPKSNIQNSITNDKISSSINALDTSTYVNQSISRGIDQTDQSIGVDQTHILQAASEQTSIPCLNNRGQSYSMEDLRNTDSSFNERAMVQMVTSENMEPSATTSHQESTHQSTRTTLSRPDNSNRKRRRPPRLFLYSQINDTKKRKKQ